MSPPPIACCAKRATRLRAGGCNACPDPGARKHRARPRRTMPSDIVVLSPHLDDAVLSLGGLISREVALGRKVEVVSCFTSGPPLDTIAPAHRIFGDYSMRRAEDERAMAVLGAR